MSKKIYSYSTIDNETIAKSFNSSLVQGLNAKESSIRLKTEGANSLDSEYVQWWEILFRQLKSPFIYLLLVAVALALLLGEMLDAGMIILFIFINTILGFYQEFKSEQTLKLLNQYTILKVKVLRNGNQIIISSCDLVSGDIVILETGDRVPADLRLIEKNDLIVDETVLTGESIAVHKNGFILSNEPKNIYEASNLVFTGTSVVSGSSKGIVIATGGCTTFGKIKKLTTETTKDSIFAKGIAGFSKFILKLTVITIVFIFLANIAIKGDSVNINELLIFSIALAVSVIPEALPIVTTLSLSRGALRLARRKVITKRLSAIEDLGNVEILCTDKTGTITENKLKVNELLPMDGRENLLVYANLAGAFFRKSIEPFDIALKKALIEKKDLSQYQKMAEYPFEPKRRRNSIVVKDEVGNKMLIVRGAPDEIINMCSDLGKAKKVFKEWLFNEGEQGHRTLAIATRQINNDEDLSDISLLEKSLNFEGCISFIDPIKKSTFIALKKAKNLGVKVVIITGDSKEVSLNVGKQIGLVEDDRQVMEASAFVSLSIQKQREILPKISVFVRTDPEQKYYIVKLLQENYEVGFLGEGINDSPSLKVAGVSIVVQGAADIAREAADIILLEKDLSVIIDGIEEGRKIFTNTIKYLKTTLASNFGNFYAVAISSLFIDFLPMLPIQLLLVNLLSDFPMIAVATDSVDSAEIKAPKKYNVKDVVLISTILGIVSTIFDFMFFGFFYKISPEVLQTNWFIGSILTELVFIYSIRTQLPFYKASFPSRTILFFSILAIITTVALPYTILGQKVFHFTPPSLNHLALILGLVVSYFICSEIIKNIYYKVFRNKQ